MGRRISSRACASLLQTLHLVNRAGSTDGHCNLSVFLDSDILLSPTALPHWKVSAQDQQNGMMPLDASVLELSRCRSWVHTSFHPFTAPTALLGDHATLSASQRAQPYTPRANTSLRGPEVQADPCQLLVTACLPCSHLEVQKVKTSLNVRPHVQLVSPGASILRAAKISCHRTRPRRNMLPFSVRVECRSFVSPRNQHVPSLP